MVLSSLAEDVNFLGGYSMKGNTKDNDKKRQKTKAKWPLKPLQLCQGREPWSRKE